ncbi:MAG: cysteine desulfurase [Microbacteriaceae bacterium]|nr:cysteine desulfurase [Microbacteriaceae bacterium]MCL2795038.1 cysteine desulfurase [Microbacteriaceae bacterium]
MILLDAAATTPVRRSALEAAWPYLTGTFGNPSSVHEPGLAAARGLAGARSAVAAFLGCRASEVVFTSGGTEGANLAIKGLALGSPRGRHVVTTRIEHEAVLASVAYLERVHGFAVSYVEADATGAVDTAALRTVLRPDTTLVTIGWANNEVGTVQDVAALAAVTHSGGALFHTDAVQAAAALPVDVVALGVDALSLSGHKLGAPKGSGAAYVRAGLPLEPLLHGGGQERGRRSGTENVAWAVALAAACAELRSSQSAATAPQSATFRRPDIASGERSSQSAASAGPRGDFVTTGEQRAAADRDAFIRAVLAGVPGARLTGHPTARLPRHASFTVAGVNGETVLLELDRRGVIASAGSACAAGRTEPSHVLLALGLTSDEASAALRFTWTEDVTAADLQTAAAALVESVAAITGRR